MNKLKYTHYDVVFQEVPNEISLAINISGCPHKCEGCHSQYLWDYIGDYISNDIDTIINKYKGLITCICFMGGDQNLDELNELLIKVRDIYNLKSCVYSGYSDKNIFDDLLKNLDYLKIGNYSVKHGGLDSEKTNQIFYKVVDCKLENITYMFQK